MEKYKIIELEIDPVLSADTGVWEVAWVESPAIEQELIYFNRQEFEDTYNDYPEGASNNACRALKWRDDHPEQDCGTQVGWTRANQLCGKENISRDTIGRMASFERHRQNSEGPLSECGPLMWLAWGGDSGIRWAQTKLKELEEMSKQEFVYPNSGESQDEFIGRCVKYVMAEGETQENALGKCYGLWEQGPNFNSQRDEFVSEGVSFDWDGVLTTDRGVKLLENERRKGNFIHIISARSTISKEMFDLARKYDIPAVHIHATGSNAAKIEMVKKMGVYRHYDNNIDVVNKLYPVGFKFDYDITDLPDYASYPSSGDTNGMLVEPILMSEDCGCKKEKYFSNLICTIDGECYDDGYSEEEMEAFNLLVELKKTNYEAFERITGALAGATKEEVMARNHKKPVFYFQYARVTQGGPPDRDFCMSIENKYFRRMEIDLLEDTNTEFGHNKQAYSKWLWKGGPNCVHAWKRFIYNPPKKKQEAQLKDLGMVSGQPGIPPKNMPNQGYYSEATKRASQRAYWAQQNMSAQNQEHQFRTNDEKRIVYMPLMIPNILIPRYDEFTDERYYVKFTPESIERIRDKFHFELRLRDTNLEHTDKKFKDAIMVESWLVEGENDKAYQVGFTKEQIPYGTWMSAYKVLDTPEGNEIWEKYIKTGKVKGASVEGNFLLKFSAEKNDEYLLEQIINILNQID